MNSANSSPAPCAQLTSRAGESVSLQSVHMVGSLDGLMLSMTTRQHYKNTSANSLETVYTFPLPFGAILLGLNVEIDGHRLQGTVLERKQATQRYEKAIDEGDTPVMVERSASGLYTANLGNLQAGEEAVIEIQYAQLLRFEQGQIRLTVPTTVAPRYGDAHQTGGLAVHESVDANLLVEYPLTLSITLTGDIARATLQSPSHKVVTTREGDSVVVRLDDGAFLDRDFVLLLSDLQNQSFVTVAPDGEKFAVLASFCPDTAQLAKPQPLALKILVDCSGSMGGDSIEAAKAALHQVMAEMDEQDWISYSRFGNDVQHELPGLQVCNSTMLKKMAKLIDQTDANLGGTEMNNALLSTYKLKLIRGRSLFGETPLPEMDVKNVLLITDGDIWDVDSVIAAARQSGHRVFAIGVGSAPTESLLRDLAEQTGGACELVSPNQDMAAVIVRMAQRMRSVRCQNICMAWGTETVWQSPTPSFLYGGDTVHLCARVASMPTASPVLSWQVDETPQQHAAQRIGNDNSGVLSRVVAAQQIAALLAHDNRRVVAHGTVRVAGQDKQALELALKYQLVTDQTNLILVHVRDEANKAQGLPSLEKIAHMQAAGWGGVGGVAFSRSNIEYSIPMDSLSLADMPAPAVWRNRTEAVARVEALSSGGMDDFEIPAFLRSSAPHRAASKFTLPKISLPKAVKVFGSTARKVEDGPVLSPLELLQAFDAASQKALAHSRFVRHMQALNMPESLTKVLDDFTVVLGSSAKAWAVVLQWLGAQLSDQFTLSRQAERLLRNVLKDETNAILEELKLQLAKSLNKIQATTWHDYEVQI